MVGKMLNAIKLMANTQPLQNPVVVMGEPVCSIWLNLVI